MRLCADTLQKKTKEYTGDDTDRLGAFKSAAALQHTTPQRALAGMMAKRLAETPCSVVIRCGTRSADAKSILNVMALAAKCGETVTIEVSGLVHGWNNPVSYTHLTLPTILLV